MKVSILAHSLGFFDNENRWYNVEDLSPDDMYPNIVSRRLWPHQVQITANPWMTVRDALMRVSGSNPSEIDAFVVHVGIVESVRRIYPLPLRRTINRLSVGVIRDRINEIENFLLHLPVNMDGWISPQDFGRDLERLCNQIRTRFRPRTIVLITINNVNSRFESEHPGSNRSISIHNDEILSLSQRCGFKVIRADKILDRSCFLIDGIHLNRRGHTLLASNILDALKPALTDYLSQTTPSTEVYVEH